MSGMLQPIFGETGAIVAQYVITLVVILALVGLVIWLVRRYAVGGIATSARGRLPRLAIVDALVVDSRHRLVLVRRDNVEHLVLIGGATDLLIEPSIVRTRLPQRAGLQPRTTASSAGAPTPPPAPPAAATPAPTRRPPAGASEEPIPFAPRPQRNVAPRSNRAIAAHLPVRPAEPVSEAPREAVLRRPSAEPDMRDFAEEEPGLPIEPPRPVPRRAATAAQPLPELRPPLGGPDELPAAAPEVEPAETEHPSAFAPLRHRPAANPVFEEEAAAITEEETVQIEAVETEPPGGPAPKVSDLEREMARLLGEISSSRSS